jgi:hypothetical protein
MATSVGQGDYGEMDARFKCFDQHYGVVIPGSLRQRKKQAGRGRFCKVCYWRQLRIAEEHGRLAIKAPSITRGGRARYYKD